MPSFTSGACCFFQPLTLLLTHPYTSLIQLSNSSDLCWLCFGYFVTIFFYNVSANFVTQCLSAVVRSILEACRVMGVWIVGLMFYYLGSSSYQKIGEAWSNWSFLELFGFIVLLLGTFSYKALVKMPCVNEDVYKLAKQDEKDFERRMREGADYEEGLKVGLDI